MPYRAGQPPHDVLVALGELVVEFSALESTLRDAFFVLAGERMIMADVLTAGVNFSVLVEKWGALYSEYYSDPTSKEAALALCRELAAVNEERNALIHSLWIVDVDTGSWSREKVTAKAKHGLRYFRTSVQPEAVRELVDRIGAAGERLGDLAINRGPPTAR